MTTPRNWFALLGVILSAAAAPALASTTYNYTGGGQTFTVPTTGLYLIVAYGGSGGAATNYGSGGLGAEIGDTVLLPAGDVLQIDVGGSGGTSTSTLAEGGGGGTFVVDTTNNTILLIAGGGGGAAGDDAGSNSSLIGGFGAGASGGGIGGGGGGGGYGGSGGGGGPFGGGGGGGYPSLAGGSGGTSGSLIDGTGGFGGGGGGGAATGSEGGEGDSGGGGGGYTGGGGGFGSAGAGGTSYDGISNVSPAIFVAGENSGDGSVVITLQPAPEPASFAMLIISLAGFLALRRRASPEPESGNKEIDRLGEFHVHPGDSQCDTR